MYKLLAVLFLVGVVAMSIVACEETDVDRTFEGPYFVRFTDSTLTYKESYGKQVAIRVHNVGPILNQPITVNYTVAGSAREGKDYSIEGTKGTVVIPANKSFGEISVNIINNANNILESQSLTFTLTSVEPSTLQVGFGQNNIVGKQMTFVIQDDCLFSGFYTGSLRVGQQTATVSDVEITSANCKEYRLLNWNTGLFDFTATKPQLTFVDNGDNTLTIPPQSNPNLGATDTLAGNGSWNPRDRRITLNLQLKLKREDLPDTTLRFTQTYTPQ